MTEAEKGQAVGKTAETVREQETAQDAAKDTGKAKGKDRDKDHEVTYILGEHLGVLSDSGRGYRKELNMVAWNGCGEKFDIREWDLPHQKMSRGITLNREEMSALRTIVDELEL